jgi:uncharacterized membrane protein
MSLGRGRVALLGLMGLGLALPVAAHEGHHKKASPSPSPAASTAAPAAPGSPGQETTEAAAPTPRATAPAPSAAGAPADEKISLKTLPWRTALLEHLHNKIVHFPLALGVAAGLMLLCAGRWPSLETAARALLVGAAALAIAAYFTGEAQHEAFEDGALEDIMRLHEKAGITTGVLLVLGVVVTSIEATRRFRWLYALVLLGVIAATGFLGGLLSHGPVG